MRRRVVESVEQGQRLQQHRALAPGRGLGDHDVAEAVHRGRLV